MFWWTTCDEGGRGRGGGGEGERERGDKGKSTFLEHSTVQEVGGGCGLEVQCNIIATSSHSGLQRDGEWSSRIERD